MTHNVITTLFTLTVVCQNVTLINKSGFPWNKDDRTQIEVSKKRCIELGKGCLKIFVKRDIDTYWAICEGKRAKTKKTN